MRCAHVSIEVVFPTVDVPCGSFSATIYSASPSLSLSVCTDMSREVLLCRKGFLAAREEAGEVFDVVLLVFPVRDNG